MDGRAAMDLCDSMTELIFGHAGSVELVTQRDENPPQNRRRRKKHNKNKEHAFTSDNKRGQKWQEKCQ